ncbi:MAG: DNRLRE domain-containing protein [Gaiellaceae bacterium]
MRGSRLALVIALTAGTGAAAGLAWAAYTATTSNPASSFAAQRIFPGERSTSAWKVEDAGDGSAAEASDTIAFADGAFYKTKNWAATWSTTRYIEFQLNDALPAGLTTSNTKFAFTFSDDDGAGNILCYYLETRRTSTSQVLATYGSSGSPIACEADALFKTVSTSLPEVTNSDIANDLTIRVYAQHSGGGKAMRVDRAVVTGTTWAGFTMNPILHTDAADTVAATTRWGLAVAADGAQFQNAGNWKNIYEAGRYLKLTFPGYPPTFGTVTAAYFDLAYKSNTSGDTTCFYFEVYSGDTVIGTHGSTGSDVDCNATTSFETISTSLPEIDTAYEATNAVVKVYMKNSGNRPVLVDNARLRVTYSLASGSGCATQATEIVNASKDTMVQEDSAGDDNYGTSTTLDVKSEAAKTRRTLLGFDYPAIPAGCRLTALLEAYVSAVQGTRTLQAYQAASSWDELTVTWNTRPGYTGSAATTSNGTAGSWRRWDATSIVQAHLSTTNTGFVVRDSVEGDSNFVNTFQSRETTNKPRLLFAYGTGAVPYAVDMQATNGGATVGKPEAGDTIAYTYSEELDAASILSGWNGSSTAVTLRIMDNGGSDFGVAVWNAANTAQLPLGTFDLLGDYIGADASFNATMVKSGATITVTLGALASGTVKTETAGKTVNWNPSSGPRDLTGNYAPTWSAAESGAVDVEF